MSKFYSETSYYISIPGKYQAYLLADGKEVKISDEYRDANFISADDFSDTQKVNRTTMTQIFMSGKGDAMTVVFLKKEKAKTRKVLKAEQAAKVEAAMANFSAGSNLQEVLEKVVSEPVLPTIPGEERVMRGYHLSEVDGNGRVSFNDIDADDGHKRLVDPRTIQQLVYKGVKYILK